MYSLKIGGEKWSSIFMVLNLNIGILMLENSALDSHGIERLKLMNTVIICNGNGKFGIRNY